ncbi:MAG: hypothetical protein AAF620_12650 [Bacteroidota bacterium]
MKFTITFVFLVLIVFSFSSKTAEEKSCRKGDFSYSLADYKSEIFINEWYQHMFDSILAASVYDCFCQQNIKHLPTKLSRREKRASIYKDSIQEYVSIEPLFVDLNTFDGLYGKRVWKRGGINTKFRCGFWHYLFVLSNREYIPLTKDSIKNVNIIKDKLSTSFTQGEVNRIINSGIGHNVICSSYTFLYPELIKNHNQLVWDSDKEIEAKKK